MSRTPPPDFFDETLRRMESGAPAAPPPSQDGFLFSGNRHESVPRALFFDRRLTPLERNAWQVIRLKLNGDGVTAFPTYEELRPWLSSMPCAPKASHETVARALNILRLTRWLSLVRRRRDRKTGRIQGNLYVLHDEPLTPFEAIQLDPEYLSLLSRALDHAAKAVRLVGQQILRELGEDPLLAGKLLPSRLHILMQRMAAGEPVQDDPVGETCPQKEAPQETYPQGEALHDSEEGGNDSEESKKTLLRNGESPSSESEAGGKPAPEAPLRNPKKDSTVLSTVLINNSKEVRTVPRAREGEDGLRWPQRFHELKEEQQAGARVALGQVHSGQQQAVLDEWDARCREGKIRHPAAYLFGIVQKALRGEFKVWAGQATEQSAVAPHPSRMDDQTAVAPPVNSEVAREYLVHIRAMLRGAPYLPGSP
ncbi:MAG: hypothetical protein LBI87_02920 [Candidatus Accumulibacter sp.]|jgi:hypothetical protein|nr:hypothetical protein [Accumulibacter sp.]